MKKKKLFTQYMSNWLLFIKMFTSMDVSFYCWCRLNKQNARLKNCKIKELNKNFKHDSLQMMIYFYITVRIIL